MVIRPSYSLSVVKSDSIYIFPNEENDQTYFYGKNKKIIFEITDMEVRLLHTTGLELLETKLSNTTPPALHVWDHGFDPWDCENKPIKRNYAWNMSKGTYKLLEFGERYFDEVKCWQKLFTLAHICLTR